MITTFQVSADIIANDQGSDAVMKSAISLALRWIEARFGSALPSPIPPVSFERDHWGQRSVECVSIADQGIWSARLTHADEGTPPVAGRTWTTDIAFHNYGLGVAVAVRCVCASRADCEHEVNRTRPGIVGQLARHHPLEELRRLSGVPWILQDDSDLDELHALLIDNRRTMPVIMLTQPPRNYEGPPLTEFVLDAVELAKKTLGVAHVVQMPYQLGYAWSERVGKPWSVYLGAVRTYRAGLDFDADLPASHPRTILERIIFWTYKGLTGEPAFQQFLIDQSFLDAATKRLDLGGCLFVTDARARESELARERLRAEVDSKGTIEEEVTALRERLRLVHAAHEKQIGALKGQIKEAEENAEQWSNDSIQAEDDRRRFEDQNKRLRLAVESLRHMLRQKTGEAVEASIEIPAALDDLDEWVGRHLAGRLIVHPRAFQGLKRSEYENIELVYRVLLLLANEYRDMRLGNPEAKAGFDRKLDELNLRCDGSITREQAGTQGDTYFIRYPLATSPRVFLEFHIRSNGNTRDPRRCLAIYYFWDDDTQQVVIGWLPSHLNNRLS